MFDPEVRLDPIDVQSMAKETGLMLMKETLEGREVLCIREVPGQRHVATLEPAWVSEEVLDLTAIRRLQRFFEHLECTITHGEPDTSWVPTEVVRLLNQEQGWTATWEYPGAIHLQVLPRLMFTIGMPEGERDEAWPYNSCVLTNNCWDQPKEEITGEVLVMRAINQLDPRLVANAIALHFHNMGF